MISRNTTWNTIDDIDEETEREGMGIFGNVKSLAYHESNDEDPYITLKEVRNY